MRTDEVDLVVQIHVDDETILTRLESAQLKTRKLCYRKDDRAVGAISRS